MAVEKKYDQNRLTDFPIEEYQNRIERLKELLAEKGLDAIVVSEYNNFRYFAGFNTPFSAWTGYIRTRPFIAILSRDKDPLLIVHASFYQATRDMTWIDEKNIVEWVDLPFTSTIIERYLKELGLVDGTVLGFELGGEQRFGFPPGSFLELKENLSGVQFVDADEVLTELRIIKSEREIDSIRKACKITADAYTELFNSIRLGDTEIDIELSLRRLMTTEEGEGPNFSLVSVHPGGVTGRKPAHRSLQDGDVVWIDAGSIYNGYRSDFSRVAVGGNRYKKQKEAYDLVRSVTMNIVARIEPGMRVSLLNEICDEELKKRGIPPKKAGRIGHGIGLDTGEAPSVMSSDPTITKPGMVFTIEPGYLTDFGYFVLEEICAVTEKGYEILTVPSWEEIPVIK